MHVFDWILVVGSLFLVLGIGIYTQQYMKSVADFMSAGRVARRYLLAVSRGEMQSGAVVYVAMFEVISQSGFISVNGWWSWLAGPVTLFVTIVGFVIYRYRETRAMTLGQFFEIRYSKAFRLFAGFLGFFAGLLNFGIIPGIGARFMVYFFEMPTELHLFGMTVPTYIPLMAAFLLINVFVTLTGGLITIMMTNCVEGILSQILYLVLIFGLLSMFSWTQISETLGNRPPGQSFLNPMDSSGLKDFNLWFVLMGILGSVYGTMAWQNQSSYNSAPLTAHEARMGGLLGRWRGMGQGAVIILLAVCAMTYLQHPQFAAASAQTHAQVAEISNPQMQKQMQIPIAVTHLLPVGLKGAFCAILLLGIFGGDSTHLHSWGSLFIQDVVLPLRKKPFTPQQHIRFLRISIAGVAVFAFLFGVFFRQIDYIAMWWTITMSLFLGGAGSAIIGGLYWKKGTTAAAWAGLLTGSSLSLGGILAKEFQGQHLGSITKQFYLEHVGPPSNEIIYAGNFIREGYIYVTSLNSQEISFCAMLIAVAVYVIVSLLTCKEDFNMDRMLHRGAYAVIKEEVGDLIKQPKGGKITWGRIIGYDENFTPMDKVIAGSLFAWTLIFCLITVIGTLWNLVQPWPLSVWSEFWHINAIIIPVTMAVVTGVWFTWGGVVDSIDLFKRLHLQKINPLDNGAVVDHQNLDESVLPDAVSPVGAESVKPDRSRSSMIGS